MTPEQQLEEVRWHKTLADAYLDEGQFGRALASYDRVRRARPCARLRRAVAAVRPDAALMLQALVVFVYAFPEGEQEREFDDLRGRCQMNAALAALRAQLWETALKRCSQAAEAGVDSAKLWYRRAVAYRGRDDFDQARDAIARALELAPDDAACKRERAVLANKVRGEIGLGKAGAIHSCDLTSRAPRCAVILSPSSCLRSRRTGSGPRSWPSAPWARARGGRRLARTRIGPWPARKRGCGIGTAPRGRGTGRSRSGRRCPNSISGCCRWTRRRRRRKGRRACLRTVQRD